MLGKCFTLPYFDKSEVGDLMTFYKPDRVEHDQERRQRQHHFRFYGQVTQKSKPGILGKVKKKIMGK